MTQQDQPGQHRLDGPTLRAVRESLGIPLRKVAQASGWSHGHLSKVEHGEYGRPLTAEIVAAYQRATGIDMYAAAQAATERTEGPTARRVRSWIPGDMTDRRRTSYNAAMGALSIGGHLGEPFGRLLDTAGRPICPSPPEPCDIEQLEAMAELMTACDLRYGAGQVSQSAKHLLRWAVTMLDLPAAAQDKARLHAAVGTLAHRAAWSAFDVAAHESARGLFRLALYAAVYADDANLRAHVLADAAAQHNELGYHHDALQLLRTADGDERTAPAVRMVLHTVRARTHAALGDTAACQRAVAQLQPVPANHIPGAPTWVGRLADSPGPVHAGAGHALAVLAARTSDPDTAKLAVEHLTQAAETLTHPDHARAHALTLARLATLHRHLGHAEQTAHWTSLAHASAKHVRSARLDRALKQLT